MRLETCNWRLMEFCERDKYFQGCICGNSKSAMVTLSLLLSNWKDIKMETSYLLHTVCI